MKFFYTLALVFLAISAQAADGPYDEKADAKADIRQALTAASAAHKTVIVVFGANWCPDCKLLEYSMEKGASASLMAQDFKIVKVDIGHYDKNVDLAHSYGVPLKITNGVPEVLILSTNNQPLYITKNRELADARKLGDQGIYEFLKKMTAAVLAKN